MERFPRPHIETRKPILNAETAIKPPEIDKQWQLISETVRREILTDAETRRIVADFITTPISESLPETFLEALASNKRLARLKKRYDQSIGELLKLQPVPDEVITPDISNANSLTTPADVEKIFNRNIKTQQEYDELMQQYIDARAFSLGITVQEKWLIAIRYRFARDVKMLALGAEVLEHKDTLHANEQGDVELPSGTAIHIHEQDSTQRMALMNPQLWRKRKQLKDRVYEAYVGTKKYLLKEKKTARHTDTKRHGHIPGATSREELATAVLFQQHGTVEQDDIKISWEKPVASVTFPDEFQFTLFECETGLLEIDKVVGTLAYNIQNHETHYREEYEKVKAAAVAFKNHKKVTFFEDEPGPIIEILQRLKLKKPAPFELTFAEFAKIKALRMERQARALMNKVIIKNGYSNSDIDGYAFKINIRNGRAQLELFGFDFEYFSKTFKDEHERTAHLQRYAEFEKESEQRHGIGFLQWNDGFAVSKEQRAGYLALLQTEGIL